jgi:hypothetical protein
VGGHQYPPTLGIVIGILEFSINQHGLSRECALGKNSKASFPRRECRYKGILDLIHSNVSSSMLVVSL